jgi:hypothetical protein
MQGCCQTGPGNAYETPNRDRLHGRIYRIAYDSARATPPLRLDTATPAQLVRALTNDNLFWRLTAQRLLVEGRHRAAIPALITSAQDHTADALGLNPGALHALWTLHGLGALGSDPMALAAARRALHHPAASVRRAALMMLPRSASLLDDVLQAGILPDRASPWPVDYTVGTAILQDADAHVRLEALLVLAELPASPRAATAIAEVILHPDNARDPWIPDAIAMAGARQGAGFLAELAKRAVTGGDSASTAGMRRAVQKMARHHAAQADPAAVVALIASVPDATAPIATSLLDGIAEGWPEERPPQLNDAQRAALRAAARGSSGGVAESFGRVAARWALPDIFRDP